MGIKYFDVRDIFRTPRLALSGKKILTHLAGLGLGYGIYSILTYLAMIINGQVLSDIWHSHHFFPSLFMVDLPVAWYAWLISGFGIFCWAVIYLLCSLAVSRITYKQLKGDTFFSIGDGLNYIKKHGISVIMSPVGILLIIIFFLILALIVGFLSKWPGLDIIFLGLPYLIYFFIAIFLVYSAFVFLFSIIISPSIVASSEDDTLETIFQSYSTLWAQPWRFLLYEVIVAGLTIIAVFIYGHIMLISYNCMNWVLGCKYLMGDKIFTLTQSSSKYIFGVKSSITYYISEFFNIYTNSSVGIDNQVNLSGTEIVTSVLLGAALFIISGTVIAYLFSNFSVGNTIIYIVLKKKKDEQNLLDRIDEDEEEKNSDDIETDPEINTESV